MAFSISPNRSVKPEIQQCANSLKSQSEAKKLLPIEEIQNVVLENDAHYPDLRLLAEDALVNASNDYAAVPREPGKICSQMVGLKGDCNEYNRSHVGLLCFNWLKGGSVRDYAMFTEEQQKEQRLSFREFQALHQKYNTLKFNLGKYGLNDRDTDGIICALTVLGDIGKSKIAHANVKKILQTEENGPVDPDDYKKYLCQKGDDALDTFQVYRDLDPLQKEFVKANVLREIHLGHATHAENGKHTYESLEKNRSKCQIKVGDRVLEIPAEILFDLADFVHIIDVAGAMGNKNNQGSSMLTTDVYNKLNIVSSASRSLITDSNKTPKDTYYEVLTNMCEYIGFKRISLPITDQSPLQVKITAFLFQQRRALPEKLSSSNDLNALYEMVQRLPQKTLENIWENFGVDAKVYNTYMPALLNAKPVKDPHGLAVCLAEVIPYLTKEYFQIEFDQKPLNFNKIIPYIGTIIFVFQPESSNNSVQNGTCSLDAMLQVNKSGEALYIEPKVSVDAIAV